MESNCNSKQTKNKKEKVFCGRLLTVHGKVHSEREHSLVEKAAAICTSNAMTEEGLHSKIHPSLNILGQSRKNQLYANDNTISPEQFCFALQ